MSTFDFDALLRGIFSPNPILVPMVCPETTSIDTAEEKVAGDLHRHPELMRMRSLIHQLEERIEHLTREHEKLHESDGQANCGEILWETDNLSAHAESLRQLFHVQLQRAYKNSRGEVAKLRADWKVVTFVDMENCEAGCPLAALRRFGPGCS